MVGPILPSDPSSSPGNVIFSKPPGSPKLQQDGFIGSAPISVTVAGQKEIPFPEGEVDYSAWLAEIFELIKSFRDAIRDKELTDYEISRRLHLFIADNMQDLSVRKQALIDQVGRWNTSIAEANATVALAFENLQDAFTTFNDYVLQISAEDGPFIDDPNETDLDELNDLYDYYNNLTPQQVADDYYGGDLQAAQDDNYQLALDDLNTHLSVYNQYAATRPSLQSAIDTLLAAVGTYNTAIGIANNEIKGINNQRARLDLPPLPLFEEAPTPNPNPLYVTLPQQTPFNAPLFPIQVRAQLTVPAPGNSGSVTPTPAPNPIPDQPNVDVNAVVEEVFAPFAASQIGSATALLDLLDLIGEYIYQSTSAANAIGANLTTPNGLSEKLNPSFTAGGAVGSSASLGLHTRKLEIILSSSFLRSIAQNLDLPITDRVFSTLQFTALELLANSSLLSAVPAMRTLASRMGMMGASSPSIPAAVGLGFAGQVLDLVNSDVLSSLVNAQMSALSFFARMAVREAQKGVNDAEAGIANAISSGNFALISSAVDQLTNATLNLNRATELNNALGSSSLGELAAGSEQLTAALNLSLLSISVGHLAQALGMPELIPQLFAQISQLTPEDLQMAGNTGLKINDALDNPIGMASLKQFLSDTLTNQFDFDPQTAANLINSAVNGVITSGNGINSFTQLHDLLLDQFLAANINPLVANTLANQSSAMIRGELGGTHLNAQFTFNGDSSSISAAVADQIFGATAATHVDGLQAAIERAGKAFVNQRQFRDSLVRELTSAGYSDSEAVAIANHAALFALNGTFPTIGVNNQTIASSIAKGTKLSQGDAQGVLDTALERAQAFSPFNSQDDFLNVLRGEVQRAVQEKTGFTNGNDFFDQAISSGKAQFMDIGTLAATIGQKVQALLTPDLGTRNAQEIKDQILNVLLGGTNQDEIAEKQNPLSVLNQVQDQVDRITNEEDLAALRKSLRQLVELLEALSTPNAQAGFTIRTLGDNPGNFVRACNSALGSAPMETSQVPV